MRKLSLWTWFLHCSLIMIPLYVRGETVGGPVSGTWTAAASPYIVDSTIVILPNDTLTIEPRVVVLFGNSDTLKVYGTLLARGTEEDSILFLDYELPSWKGIWFIGMNACNSILEYVFIEKPTYGVRAQDSEPTIQNSSIFAKSVGIYAHYSDLTILDSYIRAEGQEVDAIRIYESDIIVRNCIIDAINFDPTRIATGLRGRVSVPDLSNSIITVHGVGISFGYWLDHVNKGYFYYNLVNVISESQAYGIFMDHCNYPTFVNNTIVVESDHFADNCIYIYENSNPTIENCILYGDGSSQGVVTPQGMIELMMGYSDVYNHTQNYVNCVPCTTSISLDPLFVDPESDDFQLKENSPCIDAGNPLMPPDPDGTRADMGCFPFNQATGIQITPWLPPSEYTLLEAFPNPFNPVTSLQVSLPFEQQGSLAIYNQRGRIVSLLENGEFKPGIYRYRWNAELLSSGIYWAVLKTDRSTQVIQLIRLK